MYDIDLVEVLFKDQYFSRSDISRMRNSLVCVTLWRCYLNTNTSVKVREQNEEQHGMYDLDLVEVLF